MTVTRPVLRYHGGKWRMADWIISQFPPHRVYVEPFGGGGSVLLKKPRSYAEVYNDAGGEIVNLFRVVRDRGDELARALELTPYARDEFDLSYVATADPVEQARRTLIRSQMGFGGNSFRPTKLNRPMRRGFRTYTGEDRSCTPMDDWFRFPAALPAIIERLQGVVIENADAVDVMRAHDGPATLFYVDPPYVTETRGDTYADYTHEMSDDDHRRLATFLKTVQGGIVVSGYACDLYDRELYAGWERLEKRALADGARERTEVLWMRNCDHGLFAGTK